MQITLTQDGSTYDVVHDFANGRAIVLYNSGYILVDRIDSQTYEISGEPARLGEETEILNALIALMRTTTTVTRGPE